MKKIFRLMAFLSLGCFPARAGQITLQIDAAATVSNRHLLITCRVRNLGDDDAEKTKLQTLDPDEERGAFIGSLPAGSVRESTFSVPLPPGLLRGRYHQILQLTYSDRAGAGAGVPLAVPYHIAPLAGAPHAATTNRPSLIAELSPIRLGREGRLILTAAALNSATSLPVRVRLATPEAIGLAVPPFLWRIPAGGASRTFSVTNHSARPRSRYKALAVLDFTVAGRHESLVAEASIITPPPLAETFPWRAILITAAIAFCLAPRLSRPFRKRRAGKSGSDFPGLPRWLSPALVVSATLLIAWQVMPPEILTNTTAVGGDTVAHHYIVTQLRRNLLEHGRIISWAPGWWSGFPLFQYYFPLPYLVILLLDLAIPYNLAFKLGSILALVLTPLTFWLAARTVRLPRPIPAYLACAAIPILLDTTHTMWGVNAYSTLAGMIANSYSFALLPLALAAALRDARAGRFRISTALLMSAVILSHFFTSLFMIFLCAAMPFLPGVPRRRRAFGVLLAEGLLTVALCSWWLVPLVAKRPWSVDFGVNWTVSPLRNLPIFLRWMTLPILGSALLSRVLTRTTPQVGIEPLSRPIRSFTSMLAVMLTLAVLLFLAGFGISPIFVNIRLWPFIVYSLTGILAVCAASLSTRFRMEPWGLVAFGLLTVALGWDRPNHARTWARHNFRGLEAMPDASAVFSQLVMPLHGSPGRLAYDLHPDNERLGSSRIFECVPHLIDKPIIEGGLVNSALGSLPAYLIQSETSDNAAGFPPIVKPREFNMEAATLHLSWMNVVHFIARSPRTRAALRESPAWQKSGESGPWSLFVNQAHEGEFVTIPRQVPQPVTNANLQADLLEWMYRPEAAGHPFALIPPGEAPPDKGPPPISRAEYLHRLNRMSGRTLPEPDALFESGTIRTETIGPRRIVFTTDAVDQPHIVAVSWFPNWRASGASGPYPVTPGLMLLYPRERTVELFYADLPTDKAGRGISLSGIGLLLILGFHRIWKKRSR